MSFARTLASSTNNPSGGYGGSAPSSQSSGNASERSNPSSLSSSGYGGSDQSTTGRIKEKSGEYAQQAKSTANQTADKAREGKL